jgi:S1-C subfamily serine protease/DNA-binding NarL/FixJ family response regulator
MDFNGNKLMVVEADPALRRKVSGILSEAGYEVCVDYSEGLRSVVAFEPDVVIFGADPPKLDCCDLLTQIKGSYKTKHIRLIMLAHGGAEERSFGLDLGADDVLSIPFDDHELLARVRAQLREKDPEDRLRESIQITESERRAAIEVVEAVTQERRRLTAGLVFLLAVALVAVAGFLFFYRHTKKEEVRVHAAITNLQAGIITEAKLVEVVQKAQEDMAQGATESKTGQLPAQLSSAGSSDVVSLKRQVRDTDQRLKLLEVKSRIAKDVIRSYSPSVALIHVVVGFKDRDTGLPLRYSKMTSDGEPAKDAEGHSVMGLHGNGTEVRINAYGTGFVVSSTGQILTNHHVVEPWWQDDDLGELLKHGFEPVVFEVAAYFPTVSRKVPLHVDKISSEADLAVVTGDLHSLNLKPLDLDDSPGAAVSGEPVVLLGYPTALDAILVRAGDETLRSIAASETTDDANGLMKELARRRLIRPVNTQGHIGDVLPDKIIYDAQTASGGSGSPLFNAQGRVIGVNFAVMREFGGSNIAIPVRYARSLLPRQVASAR